MWRFHLRLIGIMYKFSCSFNFMHVSPVEFVFLKLLQSGTIERALEPKFMSTCVIMRAFQQWVDSVLVWFFSLSWKHKGERDSVQSGRCCPRMHRCKQWEHKECSRNHFPAGKHKNSIRHRCYCFCIFDFTACMWVDSVLLWALPLSSKHVR